jgi:hypothetical protein
VRQWIYEEERGRREKWMEGWKGFGLKV